MKKSVLAVIAAIGLLCGLWAPTALAQAVYGSIIGTVTDPSGAAVANAKVTATSQTKNTVTEATSNESGNYAVTHLIPDVYTIRILGQGFKIAMLGVAAGFALALGATRVMASLLYGVSAEDPLTFFAISILLTVVALAASWIPARRALSIDPNIALRHD